MQHVYTCFLTEHSFVKTISTSLLILPLFFNFKYPPPHTPCISIPYYSGSSAGVPIFYADVNYEHSDRESDAAPPKKRRKPQKSFNQSSPAITDFSEYDADIEATDTVDESENETQSDNDE